MIYKSASFSSNILDMYVLDHVVDADYFSVITVLLHTKIPTRNSETRTEKMYPKQHVRISAC